MSPDSLSPQTSVAEFLESLASEAPTPGGGGAAALALAQAAALVAMTARLTVGRRRYRNVETDMHRIIERADAIRAEATGLIGADAKAYRAVMAAFGLSRGSEVEQTARRVALARAGEIASRVPAQAGRLASEVIELAHEAVQKGNRNVISDAGAAASLARATIRISEMNIAANQALIEDAAVRAEFERELERLRVARDRADAPVDRVLAGEAA
jgi:formiminotetrahydrofolate cyclodeaminase